VVVRVGVGENEVVRVDVTMDVVGKDGGGSRELVVEPLRLQFCTPGGPDMAKGKLFPKLSKLSIIVMTAETALTEESSI